MLSTTSNSTLSQFKATDPLRYTTDCPPTSCGNKKNCVFVIFFMLFPDFNSTLPERFSGD